MRPGKIDWGQVLIALISCHNVFSCSRIDYDYIKILENVVSTFMIQHQWSKVVACDILALWEYGNQETDTSICYSIILFSYANIERNY